MGYRTLLVAFLSLHIVHRIYGVSNPQSSTTFQTPEPSTIAQDLHHETSASRTNTHALSTNSHSLQSKNPLIPDRPFKFNDSFKGFPLKTSWSKFVKADNHMLGNLESGNFGETRDNSIGPSVNQPERKRYLDGVGSALIKKKSVRNEKRYLDGVGSSLIKKDTIGTEKRYLDGVGSSLIKKNTFGTEKRYLDGVGSSLIKKNTFGTEKRYLDGVGSSLIKKNTFGTEKRYLDGVGSSLIKKNTFGTEKRYLDGVGSSLIKKNSMGTEKRYLDGVGSSLIKKDSLGPEKRYLDGVGSALIKKDNFGTEKRYLDGVGSALIKKNSFGTEKRYLDGVGSALIKKNSFGTEKRYLDGVGSSLIKKNSFGTEKRYLDGVGSSLIKKNSFGTEKRYLDGVGSALIKKNTFGYKKRHLDGVGSALIKKNSQDKSKRYLDGVARSLIKKNKFQNEGKLNRVSKRSISSYSNEMAFTVRNKRDTNDHLKNSQIVQGNSFTQTGRLQRSKRYLDGVGSSLIKKDSFSKEKRYLDDIGSSLVKKENQLKGKRYLDGVGSSLIKKKSFSNVKRYLDGVGSALIKKESQPNEKRYLDGVGSSLIKKSSDTGHKRYLDHVASFLMKRYEDMNRKRYLDNLASSLIRRSSGDSVHEKRYLDNVGSSLVKKRLLQDFEMQPENQLLDNSDKRYMDSVASSLIKKDISAGDKRDMDGIASSLIKKDISSDDKRYMDGIASSLIKKDISYDDKRYMDSVASSLIKKDISYDDKRYMDGIASSLIKKKRYLYGIARSLIRKKSRLNDKRYLDHVASSLIKRGYRVLSSDLLAGGDRDGRLNEYVMALLRRTQDRTGQRYGDNVSNGGIRGEGYDKAEIEDLNSGALIKRSASALGTEAEKRASEVVDDAYNVPIETKTSVTDSDQIVKQTKDGSRKRRDVSNRDDVKVRHAQLEPDLDRVRRFAMETSFETDNSGYQDQSNSHGEKSEENKNRESGLPSAKEVVGEFEDFLDNRWSTPNEVQKIQSNFPEGLNSGGVQSNSHPTSPRESLTYSINKEMYQPSADTDLRVSNNMALPASKRFKISIIRRHPRTRNGRVSFSEYIDSVPGGLAYKRHEYDPDMNNRLPGYPRVSLQTRLRALKARGASEQNVLRRFGHRTPKGKKLSEGTFSYPPTKGKQPTMLLPGTSTPPGQKSRNFLKATMGGFSLGPAHQDTPTTPNRSGSGIRVQSARFSPASQRFPNLLKANRIRPQKSNSKFFEFDSLAGNLIT